MDKYTTLMGIVNTNMAIINKRRFITQLPAVHQTEVLKNFFAATIDNLFQPGSSEPVSGYVGQKPSYYDPSKDFYVAEKTPEREAYQLEPAMVSTNAEGEITQSLCYPDLVNYLRSQGALVNNHSRLFEGDYYSWSPPVDLDKLNNSRQYVWMGDLTDEEEDRSAVTLHAPRHVTGFDGNSTFPLPPANPEYRGEYESPVVLVNGLPAKATWTTSSIKVIGSLNTGDVVETIRYGDLTKVINGRKELDLRYFMPWVNETTGVDANGIYRPNLPRVYRVGEIVWAKADEQAATQFRLWRCVVEHAAGAAFDQAKWTEAGGAEMLSSGMSVRLRDGLGAVANHNVWKERVSYSVGDTVRHGGSVYYCVTNHEAGSSFDSSKFALYGSAARRFFADGVGSAIELTPDYTTHSGGRNPHYLVIDRRSTEQSPWAKRNLWVHRSTLAWSGMLFADRVAQRPIVEFLPNIELFNYGTRRLADVAATLTTEKARLRDAFDLYPHDVLPWQEDEVLVSRINGQPVGYMSYYLKDSHGEYVLENGQPIKERRDPVGCVEVDPFRPTHLWSTNYEFAKGDRIVLGNLFYEATTNHVSDVLADDIASGKWERVYGYMLKPNDRLLIRQTATQEPEFNNLIYRVVVNQDVVLDNGAEVDVFELIAELPPERGDIVRVLPRDASVFEDTDEYWFDGEKWQHAQQSISAPLFMLYDADQNRLSDDMIYTGTDFNGSRLFGYKIGTGAVDKILGFPIENNQYAQPIFEVDPTTRRVTFEGGEVGGYYYHRFTKGDLEFSNNWFPVAEPSTQVLLENGAYEIPLNLQANPGNEEVTYISRNEWFDHFSSVMTQQDGFEGHPYTVNNWRDTAKNLGNGNKILQHRSPMLKMMLLASDPTFDVLSSIRYVEQEYTRYRHKIIQKANEFRKNGVLSDGDSPEVWIQHIIEALRLNKTAEFPFAWSTVAGDQYFIPPTPTALGMFAPVRPRITANAMICHDGAEVPLLGDFRDGIMLAFENRIYDSIPEEAKLGGQPVFEIEHFVESHWYKNDLAYARSEMNAIMAPMFERWSQQNRLDYRTNSTFIPSDPMSWNYSTCVNKNGEAVPGNYRGIYLDYYDTYRPDVCPWEMLGFNEEPEWWAIEYGAAPFTMGNTKLWEDLRDGRIIKGARAGVHERYARPDLMDFIPVDEEGELLDPVVLGLVESAPTIQNAAKQWKFGDGSPVEILWRTSPSFSFAKAQAGFLMKPARFIEQCWDTANVVKDASGQWIYLPTGNRPLNRAVPVHGEIMEDGSRHIGTGVQQWISDHMSTKGQSIGLLGSAVRGLGVRLAHKVGGFTSNDNIRALADNFGLIPSDDIKVTLYRSPSIAEEVYSGVLIEWTGSGWRVIGYDSRTPSFKIIPGQTNGPKGVITLSERNEAAINYWKPSVYYNTSVRVVHDNTHYESIRPHIAGSTFEGKYWKALGPALPPSPRVVTYLVGTGEVETVPYGTVYQSYQEVADFLLSHERYLVSRGWTFDDVDTGNEVAQNWSSATREFLTWAQVGWEVGGFITLSPAAEGAKFVAEHGMVLDTLSALNGSYGLVDRTGYPIDRRNVVVNRIDGECSLASKERDLYGARVHVGEIEHVLFFSNSTVFGDIIYAPLFNLRQPRLRLIGSRSTGWTGRLDAPGYMIIDGQIVSNFDKASTDLQTMFDIEKADNALLRDHARHVIGYDSRPYFQNLVLSETEQFEFYQGMIRQKGATASFDKLMRSDYIEQSRDLRFFEEWAVKIDEFGAIGGRSRASFLLGTSAMHNDPQMIQFRNTGTPTINAEWQEIIDIGENIDRQWVERPKNPMVTFPQESRYNSETDLPMSGYVRLNEVDHCVWSEDQYNDMYKDGKLAVGERLWVHNVKSSAIVSDKPVWLMVPRDAPDKPQPQGNIEEGWLLPNGRDIDIQPYLFVREDGVTVYRSRPNESPFVSSREFVPVVGHTYEAEFRIRKTVRETNGRPALLRPGFDTYTSRTPTADNPSSEVLVDAAIADTKSGFGYTGNDHIWVSPTERINRDMVDTTNWEVGQWYTLRMSWTPTREYTRARERIRVNRSSIFFNSQGHQIVPDFNINFAHESYADAVFEIEPTVITSRDTHGWQVYQVFNASLNGQPNKVTRIETSFENPEIDEMVTRLYLECPHGLTGADMGKTIVVNGTTMTDTEMEGAHQITNASGKWIDVMAYNHQGLDFSSMAVPTPSVTLLRPVRFMNEQLMNAHKALPGVNDGDVVYLDGATHNDPWRVYRRRRTRLGMPYWEAIRRQPYRINAKSVASALVYDLKTKIAEGSISPEPLVLHNFDVLAPSSGIIIGRAEREIEFRLNTDPANYSPNGWGKKQIGQVWWDTSTVRFLETETDYVVFGQSNTNRYESEATYRSTNWGKIAPATRVDVYEWTRQTLTPTEFMVAKAKSRDKSQYPGVPYGFVGREGMFEGEDAGLINDTIVSDTPFITRTEWDDNTGREVEAYYYWMTDLVAVPNVPFRHIDITSVKQLIERPMSQGIPWVSPILPNALVVGGLSSHLDDYQDINEEIKRSGTVVQIEIDEDPTNEGVIHDQWMLMRPNDERSLPPEWLWEKMRDSLVGFDNELKPVPAPPEIVVAEAPVTNGPIFENGPYKLEGTENEPYYPNIIVDDND